MIQVRWKFVHRLLCRVEQPQRRGRQLLAHFLGVEAGVRPLVWVVAPGEFGDGSGSADVRVAGEERGIDDESAVEDQEGAADAPEGVAVDSFIGKIDEHLKEEDYVIRFKKEQFGWIHKDDVSASSS